MPSQTFCGYFLEWIDTYKKDAVAAVTLDKYLAACKFIDVNFPELTVESLDRKAYQAILNKYAESHERVTTRDFHRIIAACVKDIFYEGIIQRDPTYKAVVKGVPHKQRKQKYIQISDLKKLLDTLETGGKVNWDWLLLIAAKTGARFAEILGLTPKDFDLMSGTVSINKTWGYKNTRDPDFMPTKNTSSIRTISIDKQLTERLEPLVAHLPENDPIFVKKDETGAYKGVFNSTINRVLSDRCNQAGIDSITIHSLRHTHASVLLAAGVSIFSVSKRLGHSTVSTTQEVYAHVLDDLNRRDEQIAMKTMMDL